MDNSTDLLKNLIIEQLRTCTDADLLDLIYMLLAAED